MALKDRESFASLYKSYDRVNKVGWFISLWAGFEVVRLNFPRMALGWKCVNILLAGTAVNTFINMQQSQYYAPLIGAYLRRYKASVKTDAFDIDDDKRKYFYIDTSQYMSYTNEDLSDEYHVHHGPQPEGDNMDSSYLAEMDKFLRGEENHFKQHKKFYDYPFQFKDKSFPSAEKVADLMHKKN